MGRNRQGRRPSQGSYSVRAVTRVLDILDLLQAHPDGLSLAEIAAAARLPRSSTFRYLSLLEVRGYVGKDGARRGYRMGAAFLRFRPQRLQLLATCARRYLEELGNRFGETVNLGVLDGTRVAYLDIVESRMAIRFAARKGDRDPIHSTALGKAIAATLADEEVRRILDAEGLARLTARTITGADDFIRALDEVRTRGFAVDNGENEEGGRCVAVGMPGGPVPAAISLSAPTVRFSIDRVEEVATALRQAAAGIAVDFERADA